jgi:CRISPR-associated protein Cas2
MASNKRWHLVAYDIREPKRLRRAVKVLKGYGLRVQYSIFACQLSDRSRERLRWELAKVLDDEDALLVFGICNQCMEALRELDTQGRWPPDPAGYAII